MYEKDPIKKAENDLHGSSPNYKSNEKAMNRNWSNQKKNLALETKTDNNKNHK